MKDDTTTHDLDDMRNHYAADEQVRENLPDGVDYIDISYLEEYGEKIKLPFQVRVF